MAHRLRRRETGAGAIEYSLIVVAIAAIIVFVVFALGTVTRSNAQVACTNWNNAANTPGSC
jgi:Flp pilus assembly pilin Flp